MLVITCNFYLLENIYFKKKQTTSPFLPLNYRQTFQPLEMLTTRTQALIVASESCGLGDAACPARLCEGAHTGCWPNLLSHVGTEGLVT